MATVTPQSTNGIHSHENQKDGEVSETIKTQSMNGIHSHEKKMNDEVSETVTAQSTNGIHSHEKQTDGQVFEIVTAHSTNDTHSHEKQKDGEASEIIETQSMNGTHSHEKRMNEVSEAVTTNSTNGIHSHEKQKDGEVFEIVTAESMNDTHSHEKQMDDEVSSSSLLDIAVVGAGIIGVITALGLLHAGHKVTMYERADNFFEVGAAMGFTGVARECMQQLNPSILEALQRVGEANRHPMNRYWDGFRPVSKEAAQSEESLLFQQVRCELDYIACLRSSYLCEMAKSLPDGIVKFGKSLESYSEEAEGVELRFADSSIAQADAVIACDGIHSKARRLLLGEDNPASRPSFTHKVGYHAIIPIADTIAALGDEKAKNQCAHLGPDAHALSFPIAQLTLTNLFIFLHDPKPWPDPRKTTLGAGKSDLTLALSNWGPGIRELVEKMPEQVFKWASFDMADYPADTYARGRVCLAGDAAHASAPFHGAGACMGVEDALVLVSVLKTALSKAGQSSKAEAVSVALQAYSAVRLERTQWLVRSSREMGDIFEWRYTATGSDPAKIKAEFDSRSKNLWDFDVGRMVAEANAECERMLKLVGKQQV